MKNDILTRYAAAAAVLVEAGCEAPKYKLVDCGRKVGFKGERPYHENTYDQSLLIAYYEQWFHQTVVPWVYKTFEWAVYLPGYNEKFDRWFWAVGSPFMENDPDPTEANIQCAEALAGVVKGGG